MLVIENDLKSPNRNDNLRRSIYLQSATLPSSSLNLFTQTDEAVGLEFNNMLLAAGASQDSLGELTKRYSSESSSSENDENSTLKQVR